mgnify:CR=1 FL=1
MKESDAMCFGESENKRIAYLFSEEGNCVEQRYEDCQKWFVRKACFYKAMYYLLTAVSGICPLLIAGFGSRWTEMGGSFGQNASVILSTAAGVAVLLNNMTKAHERWITYRGAAETLKMMRAEFLAKRHSLKLKHTDEKEVVDLELEFLLKIERYMGEENERWMDRNAGDQQNGQGGG